MATPDVRFVFAGTGTTGDMLPLLSLATALAARGYECHMLGSAPFAAQAEAEGIQFGVIAPAQCNDDTAVEHNFGNYVFPAYQPTFDYFAAKLSDARRTVVVNLDVYSASNLLCELHGLPLCRLYLAPSKFLSYAAPPWPLEAAVEGTVGASFRRFALPRIYDGWYKDAYRLKHLNHHRLALGLQQTDTFRKLDERISLHVGLFPRWFAQPASDWPAGTQLEGFLLPPGAPVPELLEAFVQRQGKPIVFTPGTGARDVARFFEVAKGCCDELGVPGVFLSPHLERAEAYGPSILHLPYAGLNQLLPKASLLVHHGGIGTAARAFEAGIPQIVCPLAYDQPDNGHRIEVLKLGRSIAREALSGHALAEAARSLWSSPEVSSALAAAKAAIAGSDSISTCASLIERELATPGVRA